MRLVLIYPYEGDWQRTNHEVTELANARCMLCELIRGCYQVGRWSTCSARCGGSPGYISRTVMCVATSSNTTTSVVDVALCGRGSATRPAAAMSCSTPCPHFGRARLSWKLNGTWSACSSRCDSGGNSSSEGLSVSGPPTCTLDGAEVLDSECDADNLVRDDSSGAMTIH
jgi:hypothetical protein